jgi:hypothetical protein
VTLTWLDLDRDRWAWADRARAELRAELVSLADPDDVASVAHVMLVGDTQAGKTTVLLWLLGVTDPAALAEAAKVLRAGRAAGRSATAAPIRYSWSGQRDQWLLIQGTDRARSWVSEDELEGVLARYRSPSGEQVRWRVGDPPLEIGIPDRLAGQAKRADLKVLDLPGLHAASPQERLIARELVTRAAPSMSLIVIVQHAYKMAAAMQDPAIADSPHLASWCDDPGRFRLVFTQAFSQGSVREDLARTLGAQPWEPAAVIRRVRRHAADQLARSTAAEVDPAQLANVLFPVDVGDSRQRIADGDRQYAASVLPANDLLLEELRGTLEERASEDGLYLSAPNLANHISALILRQRRRRQQKAEKLARDLSAAAHQVAGAEKRLRQARDNLERANRDASQVRADEAALARRKPAVTRPQKPAMEGPDVRRSQQPECDALYAAAIRLWDGWRSTAAGIFPMEPPTQFESQLGQKYSDLVDCCRECSHLWAARKLRGSQRPEHCYAQMTAAVDGVRAWIVNELTRHIEQTVSKAADRLKQAERQHKRAERFLQECRQTLSAAAAEAASAKNDAERERHAEAQDLRTARAVLAIHSRHNETYVRELADRAASATSYERGWLAVAALRAVRDLDRMYGRE